MLEEGLRKQVITAQRNEITEHQIYRKLSRAVKNKDYSGILDKISQEELKHYEFFKTLTGEDVAPDRFKVFFYFSLARLFGLNFALKLMENGEDLAQDVYERIKQVSPRIEEIIGDERTHESELISLIDEERLKYISSVVLGLNDALVELSGALVGFTLALQNTRLVGLVGLITGVAASLSMAASEYLSTKHEATDKSPLKACVYTGLAYLATVVLLISPYLFLQNIYFCLGLVILAALLVIFIFTYYISVAKGLDFKKRFLEMAGISLGVAAVNYILGLVIRNVFGIDV